MRKQIYSRQGIVFSVERHHRPRIPWKYSLCISRRAASGDPHEINVKLVAGDDAFKFHVEAAVCSCVAGPSECCNHIVTVLPRCNRYAPTYRTWHWATVTRVQDCLAGSVIVARSHYMDAGMPSTNSLCTPRRCALKHNSRFHGGGARKICRDRAALGLMYVRVIMRTICRCDRCVVSFLNPTIFSGMVENMR